MSRRRAALAAALALWLAGIAGCHRGEEAAQDAAALKARLESTQTPGFAGTSEADIKHWKETRQLYALRQDRPVWIVGGKPQDALKSLRALLSAADADGLDPKVYWDARFDGDVQALSGEHDANAAQTVELRLSDALMHYASDLALGHPEIAAQIDPDFHVAPRVLDLPQLVNAAIDSKDLTGLPTQLAPPHPEYGRLKTLLAQARKDATQGTPDAAAHVKQIELNLEHWRWMAADFGAPYILVNVPGYSLEVRAADGKVALSMRAIVGKPDDKTPIFDDRMVELVFSPYWNIPRSIERKEMLPSILRDPDMLRKKNLEVVRNDDGKITVLDPAKVDLSEAGDDVRLRQKPGEKNSLGLVKFAFANQHKIYIHDTPADSLFDQLSRDLSHGCIRIAEPEKLAAFALRDQPEWTQERIDEAMHAGTEKQVALKNPIAVHIVYLSVRVSDDGQPQFFDDVYGYDQKQTQLQPPP